MVLLWRNHTGDIQFKGAPTHNPYLPLSILENDEVISLLLEHEQS